MKPGTAHALALLEGDEDDAVLSRRLLVLWLPAVHQWTQEKLGATSIMRTWAAIAGVTPQEAARVGSPLLAAGLCQSSGRVAPEVPGYLLRRAMREAPVGDRELRQKLAEANAENKVLQARLQVLEGLQAGRPH